MICHHCRLKDGATNVSLFDFVAGKGKQMECTQPYATYISPVEFVVPTPDTTTPLHLTIHYASIYTTIVTYKEWGCSIDARKNQVDIMNINVPTVMFIFLAGGLCLKADLLENMLILLL